MESNADRQSVIRVDPTLELHPVAVAHAEELFSAIDRNRDRLRQWLPWLAHDYSLVHAIRFLENCVAENKSGEAFTAAIFSGGRLCGAIGLHRINVRDRASSIGYWVDAEQEGKGIATRACRAIVAAGFEKFGLHRIEIRCATGNRRSCAIPRRLGFTYEGVLRDAEWLYDHWVDLNVFSMLEPEWPKVTGY